MKLKIVIFISLFLPLSAIAQCPFGEGSQKNCVNGCGNFVDNNQDGYCDNSVVDLPQTTATNREDKQSVTTENKVDEDVVEEPSSISVQEIEQEIVTEDTKQSQQRRNYHFWLLTGITLGLYLLTFVLVKINVLQKVYQRRIWNAILLVAALVSCLFGLVLAINVSDMFLGPQAYKFLITWHVEAGIVMTIICIFHIIWHLKYYKNLFTKVKKSNSEN